jgi:hypothetical protein
VVLTEGLNGSEERRRAERQKWAALAGRAAAEVIGASGLWGLVQGGPVEVASGLRRPETHRR